MFGYDARANMVERAENAPDRLYHELVRRAERELLTDPRRRPENVKDRIVREREFRAIRPKSEEIFDFEYQPVKCKTSYRVVALRKNLSIEKGHAVLFDDVRYFFYITNDRALSADQVVQEARQRCNQKNLIAQLKGDVRALHAPVNTLNANWAYMVMAALAWNLKAWTALLLPVYPRWAAPHIEQRRRLLSMDFRTFVAALIHVPCQIVRGPAGYVTAFWRGTNGKRRCFDCSRPCSVEADAALRRMSSAAADQTLQSSPGDNDKWSHRDISGRAPNARKRSTLRIAWPSSSTSTVRVRRTLRLFKD